MKNKQRTHKGAAKRFKVTGSGKIMHRSPTLRHLRSSKSKGQIRKLKMMKEIKGAHARKIKKMLGIG
jgi:large subunit ribosomal protein L35